MVNVDAKLGMSSDGSGRSLVVRRVEGVEERLDKELDEAEDEGIEGTTAGCIGVGGIGT